MPAGALYVPHRRKTAFAALTAITGVQRDCGQPCRLVRKSRKPFRQVRICAAKLPLRETGPTVTRRVVCGPSQFRFLPALSTDFPSLRAHSPNPAGGCLQSKPAGEVIVALLIDVFRAKPRAEDENPGETANAAATLATQSPISESSSQSGAFGRSSPRPALKM